MVGSRFGLVWLLVASAVLINGGTRLALLVKSGPEISWDMSVPVAFAWGLLFDLGAALWWAAPLALFLALLPRNTFSWAPARWGSHLLLFAGLYILLFGAVAEWVFWDEFGVRFNFIAVDYLVYTTEVIGNIRESYPMPLILSGLGLGAAAGWFLIWRLGGIRTWLAGAAEPLGRRWLGGSAWAGAMLVVGLGLNQGELPAFANNYNRELAKSGTWSLFAAFWANKLDYHQFYVTLPDDVAVGRMRRMLAADNARPMNNDPYDLLRYVSNPGPEQQLNVIQITVESLSASFLSRYGNTEGLTPNLDALLPHALVFDNFYATGTRTVRGMEALTLSLPPTPGQSLVKRPGNENLFTLGSIFRQRGYDTAFLYGGHGYFDNMNYFFGNNGYRIIDRMAVDSDDVTFANVWGACDEDLFRWTLREADADYAANQPFFYFLMTTSNHRPYTFPDGKIDLPSKDSGRSGGVKYTDYAIGQLLQEASTKPWFNNTIFVIVADHCASSAGKTELPVENYHIPLIVYAPGGQVKPGVVDTLTSQIDYAPTLLGLLNWSYPSRFMGNDVLQAGSTSTPRALIATYQMLGYLRGEELAVLQPVREEEMFSYDPATNALTQEDHESPLIDDAIAYYQTASLALEHGRLGEYSPHGH